MPSRACQTAPGVAVFSGKIGNRPLTQHGAAPMEHIGAGRID
jgi:hypothetical protein